MPNHPTFYEFEKLPFLLQRNKEYTPICDYPNCFLGILVQICPHLGGPRRFSL